MVSDLGDNARRAARFFRRVVTGQQPMPSVLPVNYDVPQTLNVPVVKAEGKTGAELIRAIVDSPEHQAAADLFAAHPYWADRIITEYGVSLIYALISNLKPKLTVEIGSFHGKTAFAIAHALDRNGGEGMLHTVGPFDSDEFLPRYNQWPAALQQRVAFHPVNSADYYMQSERAGRRFDLTFVDGNHDYEFALFDIQCAARRTNPGGIILVDNVSQAGPILAAIDFLADNPGWREIGPGSMPAVPLLAYELGRSTITLTDFVVLQAPDHYSVRRRPVTFGEVTWSSNTITGATIDIDGPGEVICQCVLRSFGRNGQTETVAEGRGAGTITFARPAVAPQNDIYRVEIWVTATQGDVRLKSLPQPL